MSDPGDGRQDRPEESDLGEGAFEDPTHDELRRMLADARVTDPVPVDVAARLDATLAGLRDQRIADQREDSGTVVPLRRRVAQALVAAAVVVVVGAGGIGIAHLPSGGSSDNASAGSADSASGARDSDDKAVPEAQSPDVPGAVAAKALPRLTTAQFGKGVSRLMRTPYGSLDTSGQASVPQPEQSEGADDLTDGLSYLATAPPAPPVTRSLAPVAGEAGVDCAGPDASGAITWTARLDGALVALVFRPPTTDSQVVEAWSCDGTTLLAAASVPH